MPTMRASLIVPSVLHPPLPQRQTCQQTPRRASPIENAAVDPACRNDEGLTSCQPLPSPRASRHEVLHARLAEIQGELDGPVTPGLVQHGFRQGMKLLRQLFVRKGQPIVAAWIHQLLHEYFSVLELDGNASWSIPRKHLVHLG